MPWKMVKTWHGKKKYFKGVVKTWGPRSGPGPHGAMTLTEVVNGIFSCQESEAKERERRNIEK